MLALAGLIAAAAAQAETIKVGILKVGASGPLYIAQDRGYFAAEGLTVDLANFGAGQAVAVAVVSGDIDIGVTGLTAGLYNLASGGQIRVVAGLHREAHGFRMLGYFASKRAYDAGLTSLADIKGHSVAISTIGSTTHYAVGLLAMKYGFPIASVRIMPLQSFSNSAAAVIGGQADVGMIPSTLNAEMHKAGAKNLGWVGDETPWQIGAVFVTTKSADDRRDTIARFLRALLNGARDYHDAFTNAKEERADGPTAPAVLAIMAKYIGSTPAALDHQMPYVDPRLRIDVKDVRRQIEWYKAQGMVKGDITAERLIDARYAVPLPSAPH
ncbi:MAG TPA: ABC transporter substrate-binding protein [Stellaceae bacterium]|nr:ABC transporter substrate-binding protein [Stellaceae bacterium]